MIQDFNPKKEARNSAALGFLVKFHYCPFNSSGIQIHPHTVASALGMTNKAAEAACRQLCEDGYIVGIVFPIRPKDTYYSWSPKGRS